MGSTTTIFVTDADDDEVLEYDGTSGQAQRWYAFGRQGPDNVLGQMNAAAGTRETMIPDIQGSIVATLDSGTGALTKTGYQSFGENPGLASGTYQYTARRFDGETAAGGTGAQPSGLYYYRARMYSPSWGRFLQPDPIGYGGGNNLYAYVNNDPLDLIDPLGLCDNPSGCGVSGFLSGIAAPFVDLATTPGHYFGTTLPNATADLLNACGALCDPGTYASLEPALGPAGVGPAGISGALSALRAFASIGETAENTIVFGTNANATAHALAHVNELGLDTTNVMDAIRQDLQPRLPLPAPVNNAPM